MRLRITVFAALLALTGCGPAEVPKPTPTPTASALPEPDSIAVERWGNMGSDRSEWRIERSGAVRMAWDEPGDSRRHRRSFTAPAGAFGEIRAALAGLEARQGKPLDSVGCVTDSPGSGVTWRYGTRKVDLLVDAICEGEGEGNVARLDAIDRKLDGLAKTAPDLKQTAEKP